MREPARWLETAAAEKEFENVLDGWKDFDMVPDSWKPKVLENKIHENVPDGWKKNDMVPDGLKQAPEEQKFRFMLKQESIKKYFSSQKMIDFGDETAGEGKVA